MVRPPRLPPMSQDGHGDARLERDSMREFLRRETLRRNEQIARRVNEHTAEDVERGAVSAPEFLCECGNATCMERLPMTLDEFEQVHSNERRFAVLPGHELPEVERVVASTPSYAVVEKVAS
jgi:hypothetical protein